MTVVFKLFDFHPPVGPGSWEGENGSYIPLLNAIINSKGLLLKLLRTELNDSGAVYTVRLLFSFLVIFSLAQVKTYLLR